MPAIGTGRFDIQQAVSGFFHQTQAGYFGVATSASAYPAGTVDGYNNKTNASDANLHEFGFTSSQVIIRNEGGADIAYQTDFFWGLSADSGVVKSGETLYLRDRRVRGVKVRTRDPGAVAYYVTAY